MSALKIAQIAKEAGIPDGAFNVLPGFGDVGEALQRHNDVDAIAFTGSTEVGGLFMKYSGESNLKTFGLEMGGKSPFLVLDDAKINDALRDNAINSAIIGMVVKTIPQISVQIIHNKVKDKYFR